MISLSPTYISLSSSPFLPSFSFRPPLSICCYSEREWRSAFFFPATAALLVAAFYNASGSTHPSPWAAYRPNVTTPRCNVTKRCVKCCATNVVLLNGAWGFRRRSGGIVKDTKARARAFTSVHSPLAFLFGFSPFFTILRQKLLLRADVLFLATVFPLQNSSSVSLRELTVVKHSPLSRL